MTSGRHEKNDDFSVGKYCGIFLLFSLGTLYFISVDTIADSGVFRVMGNSSVLDVHIAYLFVQAAGFASFSLLSRLANTRASRKTMLSTVYVLSAVTVIGMTLVSGRTVFLICVMANLFLSGVIGSSVYFCTAVKLRGDRYAGRACGYGIGTAVLLQVILSEIQMPEWAKAAALAAAMAISGLIMLLSSPQGVPEFDRELKRQDAKPGKRYIISLLLAVGIVSIMGGINDEILTLMQVRHELSLYAFPRVFFLFGAVAAGYIADVAGRKYLSISVLIAMLLSALGILFLNTTLLLNLNACVYSLFAGFAIIFFTIPFFDIAASMPCPKLWAGMGVTEKPAFLALGTILMKMFLVDMPFSFTIGVFVFLSVIMVILFRFGGLLYVKPANEERRAFSEEKHMGGFAERYGFTPREQEIFKMLVTSDSGVREIAAGLHISRRVLQRYICSIYSKTEVKNRIALLRLYAESSK